MNISEFTKQTVSEKRREEFVKSHEESVREMSSMSGLRLLDADPSPTGGMLYRATRGLGERTEYIVWNCHHGDCLTNGHYTDDVWESIAEYDKRRGF